MARGIMYHITLDADSVNTMDETNFYEDLDVLGIDYVQDCSPEKAKREIQRLAGRFKSAGFSVKEYIPVDISGDEKPMWNCPVIETGGQEELESCIMNYFSAAYQEFVERAQAVSLREFALDILGANSLRRLITDTYDDAVYFGKCGEAAYTLDDFVRRMTPNTTYYVAPETVFMH